MRALPLPSPRALFRPAKLRMPDQSNAAIPCTGNSISGSATEVAADARLGYLPQSTVSLKVILWELVMPDIGESP